MWWRAALRAGRPAAGPAQRVQTVLQQQLGWSAAEAQQFVRRRQWLAALPPATVRARVAALLALDSPPVPQRVSQLLRTTATVLQDPAASEQVMRRFEDDRALLGYTRDEMWRVVLRLPKLIHVRYDALRERLEYLQRHFGDEAARRMVRQQPTLLTRKLETMDRVLDTLAAGLQISPAEARRVFMARPQLSSQAGNPAVFARRMAMLQRALGLRPDETLKVAARKPSVLSLSERHLARIREALAAELTPAVAHQAVLRAPGLLEQSPSSFRQRLRQMQRVLGVDAATAREVTGRMPTLMQLGEANLTAKVDFFVHECGMTPADVARSYGLLTFSLERRLRPRRAQLAQLGVPVQPSLFYLSDERFAERYPELGVENANKRERKKTRNKDE